MTTNDTERLLSAPQTGLQEFVKAAKQYDAKGISYEITPDGTETISQKLGEGWHGLGFDGQNIWMGLTNAVNATKNDWNANTILANGQKYPGIINGISGQLTSDHPIAQFAQTLRKLNPNIVVHLTGAHANWNQNNTTMLTPDNKGNLRGNIPTGTEIKAAITGINKKLKISWDDGAWVMGATQRLSMQPLKR